jgi:hypothetical protein
MSVFSETIKADEVRGFVHDAVCDVRPRRIQGPTRRYVTDIQALNRDDPETGALVTLIESRTIPVGRFYASKFASTVLRGGKENYERYGIEIERLADNRGGYGISVSGSSNQVDVFDGTRHSYRGLPRDPSPEDSFLANAILGSLIDNGEL